MHLPSTWDRFQFSFGSNLDLDRRRLAPSLSTCLVKFMAIRVVPAWHGTFIPKNVRELRGMHSTGDTPLFRAKTKVYGLTREGTKPATLGTVVRFMDFVICGREPCLRIGGSVNKQCMG